MLRREVFAVTVVVLLVCSIIVFAVHAATTDGNELSQQKVRNSLTGGGAGCATCSSAAGKVPTAGDANNAAPNRFARRTVGSRRHVMAVPESFSKDGVYIWCDPDGLWTMFWRGKSRFTVDAGVSAEKPIKIKTAVKAKATVSETKNNQLQIFGDANSRVGLIQFDSAASSVQFNVRINGKPNTDRVYVGSRLENPKQFPLKLVTRRALFRKEIQTAKSTRNQELTETFGLKGDFTLGSKKTPMPVAPSGGGGDRGGNKVGKAKK